MSSVRPADGKAAVEAVSARKPEVVLLDVALPDIDGFAVCDQLTAERQRSGDRDDIES